ncbi:class I SAM-dependent methyltransferase [Solirubrobacter soli]|uniref:class I SAM-dependent methyltransferase n=1 Tax=Solirubrobacter soli TaxID=363832 RepID=UPI000425F344|nr:class I SAM-dependent methyltransferase [Solirubrobacter soli]
MRFRPLSAPSPDAVADAAARSPFVVGPTFSALADADELRFRDEIEPELTRDGIVPWLQRKELLEKLDHALSSARVTPSGTVVELGAGSCWLSAALTTLPGVEEAIGVEFSRYRLEELAPVAIAALGADPARVTRRLADFNAHGLPDASADLVVFDAAFHHAADRLHIAKVAFRLLRPGGRLLLFREPTLALLRRNRDHGIEDEYGSFESEDSRRGYLRTLRAAGFADARASQGAGSLRERAFLLRPPLRWLNGIAFAEYVYVAVR